MRRKQCEITDKEEIKQILERVRIGRLATLGKDGYPYITPVNYVLHRDSIYFHCAHKGEKTDNIKRCDKVCFEVDIPLSYLGVDYDRSRPSCQVHQFYHCVIIRGRARFVEDLEEKADSLNALVRVHEEGGSFTSITAETKEVGLCTVIAVRIDSISAKSDLAQKKESSEKNRIAKYLHTRNLPGDQEAARYIGEK
ncbi:pyridoxamine 5'-phosphate oxidase family protein [Desulfopila inferna]|uniref:pyridoxamine 5'-phosphate oxidase family protein n=1 Tax=Desulfopila inferna TaxID=468528 RepID=UPI00196426CB|nr:pyridoxamine 5'-phosphate oxidase family protein [Desulfopila inferna]MBM9604726.1 pyridoxamine 5'-phosphate oxidase family protein [Desulfopila inferna]